MAAKDDARRIFDVNQSMFPDNAIATGADKKLINYAEKMGAELVRNGLTTSQIRNVFSELHRIVENASSATVDFYMLKPKVAYIAGRHDKVGVWLFKYIFDRAWEKVEPTNVEHLKNFLQFMEAIVAYHKANGGKD